MRVTDSPVTAFAASGMRILIVRTSALGDVVHALPVLRALRRQWPAARVGWVVEEGFAPLLDGHPDLDALIPVRSRAWRRRPLSARTLREVVRFVAALQSFAADVVLDLMGNHKAGFIAALTLAERRIGLGRRHRREPSSALWLNEQVEPLGPHAVERALSMLPAVGVAADPVDFGGSQLPAALDREADTAPYAVVLPGAGWANKRYPPAWWGEVAARLVAGGGPRCRVAYGPGEEPLGTEVVAAAGGAADLEPPAGLPELVALLRNARLVLGGDTGPLHLAHALGTPVLCLLGPTDPARNGPYDAAADALWKELPCSFCHRRFDDTKACLLELPPATVAARALDRLARASS